MKVAAVQMDIRIGEIDANLSAICDRLREAAGAGATLIAFPECAVSGYCFESLEEARPFAQPVPGPAVQHLSEACSELGVFAVFGMLEVADDKLFNVAVLTGPAGLVGVYRKTHLPYLGVDRFTSFGERPYAVHSAGDVRVGMTICYDAAFPEASRSLTLLGADVIVLPTNWPPGAERMASHAINTRAMENNVYYMAVNRVGEERGVDFIGRSIICSPSGQTLASADPSAEVILYADIDPEAARKKTVVRVPGKHIIDRLADRRPELYGTVVEEHNLPRPGGRSDH